jgi:hypothetical protein
MESASLQAQPRLKTFWQQISWPVLAFLSTRLGLLLLVWLGLVLFPMLTGEVTGRPSRVISSLTAGRAGIPAGMSISPKRLFERTAERLSQHRLFPTLSLVHQGSAGAAGQLPRCRAADLQPLSTGRLRPALQAGGWALYRGDRAKIPTPAAFKPLFLYFSAVYSESLFLLLVVLVFFFAERRKWFWAALCSALAGATRLVGVLTILPLLWFYLESSDFKWRNLRTSVLLPALGLLGPGGYMLFQVMKFGDPFMFVKSQNAPGWKEGVSLLSALDALRLTFSWNALKTGDFPAIYAVHVLAFLFGLALLIAVRRKLPFAWWVWALLTLLVSFSVWISMGRFLIVIFPLCVGTALIFKEKVFNSLLYFCTLLLSLFVLLFSHWYWVG